MITTPHWNDVENWAQLRLADALARLEATDTDAEKNRGEIRILRALLSLPETMVKDPNKNIGSLGLGFSMNHPPEHV